jgi:hypothetical protein
MEVEVEEIGILEFPDDTDQAVIDKTVKDLTTPDEPGMLEKAFPSVVRAKDIYLEEESAARKSIKTMLEDPTGRNVIHGALGIIQGVFSPLTAGVRGLLSEPIGDILRKANKELPEEIKQTLRNFQPGIALMIDYPDITEDLVETGAYFLPYGKAVQTAITGKKALEQTGSMAKALPKAKPKKPLKFPEKLPEEAIQDATAPISQANKKVLTESVIDDIVSEVKHPISKKWSPYESKRITQEIVDYITDNPDEIPKVVEKYNLSPQELAAQIKETMTLAGRDLGRMGRLAKEIKSRFDTDYMKQLTKYMDTQIAEVTTLDKFGKAFKSIENIRRAALVSQFVTTFRNMISQGGRVTLGSIDNAFQGAGNAFLKSGGEGGFGSVKSTLKGFGEGLDLFTATINRLRPAERRKLLEILESSNAIEAKAKMFRSPIQDVVLSNKIAKRLNTFNTMQEFFFRNISFEAKLRQLGKRAGIDFKNLKPDDIPDSMLKEAADYALDMTFAALPKSQFAKEWVKGMSHPIMTALINPFPRFLYGNALPFLKRFSPIQFLEAARPSVVADIVSGNPEKFTKAISEATLGTIMLNTAGYIRNSKFAGERWYQINVGEKTVDTRAFAPFSTYLFMAEAMQNPERLKPSDFGMALLSLNRIGGTGLVIADVMRGKNIATTIDSVERMAGAWVSGFTVPARTLKDLYSAIDPEEAVYRDIRENELLNPMLQNIPGVSQTLPEARSPLRVGQIKAEKPAFRQFTGLSVRTKNALEREVDKIQLDYRRIYPGTGDPNGDRIVSEIMAPLLEKAFPLLKEQTNYNQLDHTSRRLILGELFKDAKKVARAELLESNPSLALKIKIQDLPDDVTQLLKMKGILP